MRMKINNLELEADTLADMKALLEITEAYRDLLVTKELATQFAESFELVFGIDWEFTKTVLNEAEVDPTLIAQDGTFLQPGVTDESNNWANRGSLLSIYRDLVEDLDIG
jgi:hypothetical protein